MSGKLVISDSQEVRNNLKRIYECLLKVHSNWKPYIFWNLCRYITNEKLVKIREIYIVYEMGKFVNIGVSSTLIGEPSININVDCTCDYIQVNSRKSLIFRVDRDEFPDVFVEFCEKFFNLTGFHVKDVLE